MSLMNEIHEPVNRIIKVGSESIEGFKFQFQSLARIAQTLLEMMIIVKL